MSKKDELKYLEDNNVIENAQVGYQMAINMLIYEGESLWAKYNAFLVANTIFLGLIGLTLSNLKNLSIFSKGIPFAGILLCIFWFLLTVRTFDSYIYWIFSAREIEENFFGDSIKILSRGGDFMDGREVNLKIRGKNKHMQMSCIGRFLRIRYISYLIICLFFLLYIYALFL